MKNWIYTLDFEDTLSVVDMVEHTGTTYIPQCEGMEVEDTLFVATLEYGQRFIYRLVNTALNAWISDDGEAFCDAMASQPMNINDGLLLEHFQLKLQAQETPSLLDDAVAEKIKKTMIETDNQEHQNDKKLKMRIIYDAYESDN